MASCAIDSLYNATIRIPLLRKNNLIFELFVPSPVASFLFFDVTAEFPVGSATRAGATGPSTDPLPQRDEPAAGRGSAHHPLVHFTWALDGFVDGFPLRVGVLGVVFGLVVVREARVAAPVVRNRTGWTGTGGRRCSALSRAELRLTVRVSVGGAKYLKGVDPTALSQNGIVCDRLPLQRDD